MSSSQEIVEKGNQSRFAEFSPRKLFTEIILAFRYLIGKWYIILAFGVALGTLYFLLNYAKKPQYTAEMSFALDEGAVKSSGNSITSLSEELGFGPSYEAGGIFSSMTNILELMQSKFLIEKTLCTKAGSDSGSILYADFFLDSLGYRSKWMAGSPYEKLDFLKKKRSKEEERFANSILNAMFETLSKQAIKVDRKGKGTTLIAVSLTTENEAFSKYFLEALIEEVSQLYIDIKTHRAKVQLDFIQKRADSVRLDYSKAMYGKAFFTDANVNVSLQAGLVPAEKSQTDIQILRETYVGLMRSMEAAKTSLMQDTPLFQYLDRPVFPLKVNRESTLFRFVVFMIIGSILGSVFLLARRFYRFVMSEDDSADTINEETEPGYNTEEYPVNS